MPFDWQYIPFHGSPSDMRYLARSGYLAPEFKDKYSVYEESGGMYVLEILNVDMTDAGHYRCIEKAGAGELSYTTVLSVFGML